MGRRAILIAVCASAGCTLSLDSRNLEYTGGSVSDPIAATCTTDGCDFKVRILGFSTDRKDDDCPATCPTAVQIQTVSLTLAGGDASTSWQVELDPPNAPLSLAGPSTFTGPSGTVNVEMPLPDCNSQLSKGEWVLKNKKALDALAQQKLCFFVRLKATATTASESLSRNVDLAIRIYPDEQCTITSVDESCEPLYSENHGD